MAKGVKIDAPAAQQLPMASDKNTMLFIGKAWNNKSKSNKNYTNIVFDRGIEVIVKDIKSGLAYSLSGKDGMLAFPNAKREGKKDADLRLSISTV